MVAEMVVPSCGQVVWSPPPNTEGLVVHYVARFFTGETMLTSPESERDLQRFFDNPDRRFAMANKLPSDCSRVVYAQVYTTIVSANIVQPTVVLALPRPVSYHSLSVSDQQ